MSALQCRRASKIRHLNRFGVQVEQKVTTRDATTLYHQANCDNFAAISVAP